VPPDARLTEAERRTAEAVQRLAAQQHAETMRQLPVKSGVALAVMSVVLGWPVAGRVLRPLRTMTATIQLISARNVHERLAVTGPRDELKNLADTVDGLLGRLESALDSHKRFVANAAHELRTPLTLEHALLEETVLDTDTTVEEFRARFEDLMVRSGTRRLRSRRGTSRASSSMTTSHPTASARYPLTRTSTRHRPDGRTAFRSSCSHPATPRSAVP
jgi:signal transduction histidine kinase